MGERIFCMCLVLMAVVGANQPLRASENNGIVAEDSKEILHRMQVREERLRLQKLHLEKEIADREATRKALARYASHLEKKIQRYMCKVLGLLIPALFMLCRQQLKESTAERTGEGETDPGLLWKAWVAVALLTKPFVPLRVISISMGTTVAYLQVVASRLLRFPLKLIRSTNKDFVP